MTLEEQSSVPPLKEKGSGQWKQMRLAVSKSNITIRNPTEEVCTNDTCHFKYTFMCL